jgi:hypothetical protein
MAKSRLTALAAVLLSLTAVAVFATSSTAGPVDPDIPALTSQVTQERVRGHVEALVGPRNSFSQPEAADAAAGYVQAELESYGYAVELPLVPAKSTAFPNVFAVQEGSSCSDRVFVVGAHYDSVPDTPGADDNASGVAGVLEVARVLADTSLPATVWFVGFALEENGLVGSRDMAREAEQSGIEIVGMASLEMIGFTTNDADFIVVLGNTASIRLTDSFRRANEAYVPELDMAIVNLLGNGEKQRDSRRSDHAPFWDAGYQAVIVTDTANFRNPNYHQPSDTIDTLDLSFATNVTKAVLATTVDYLTFDGNGDGEADVCSGPLIATPTSTPVSKIGDEPSISLGDATPGPAALPDAGSGVGDAGPAGVPVLWLVAGGLLVLLGGVLLRQIRPHRHSERKRGI